MRAKKRLLEFDDDFDNDNGSIHSSELSVKTYPVRCHVMYTMVRSLCNLSVSLRLQHQELDSDTHSLSSLKSCAESWIEDAEYKMPAEGWVKFATPAVAVR